MNSDTHAHPAAGDNFNLQPAATIHSDNASASSGTDGASGSGSTHDGGQQTGASREKPRERRQRTKWTPDEVTALLKGVEKHGVSKWVEILADPDLHFAASRKPVDLKDKWRVMTTRRKQLPNLPSAADVASWTTLMATTHRPASSSPAAGPLPILTTTALPPPVTFQPLQRKRPREDPSPSRAPVALAINRGSTPTPLESQFSLFGQNTDPAMWDPVSPAVASSRPSHPPPPAPPPVPAAHHPLVLDLLPPDLMLGSLWEPADTPPIRRPSDAQLEDTDSLASFFAQCTMPPSSFNTSSTYLPPSPSATPVTSPSPPPTLLAFSATDRGRPLTRVSVPPLSSINSTPQDPDPTRDFFNSRYHPLVDHRVRAPPKAMLDWANVMRVRSVSPESRNRFVGVPRSASDPTDSPQQPAQARSDQDLAESRFDMSEMLQAVMCLDPPTRSHVFELLSTREFANSPHTQAVAAKYALRPQDMVPVASPRDEAEPSMSVDGEQGLVTQEMRRVLERGRQEVLRVTKRGDGGTRRDDDEGGGQVG
ncbi:hypothetical protein BCR44DRAFT_281439 [Catenaria anguillulae PL171]|uniref:Uncharacterized protein n=1 Tax=Catenaria anguillulae PL171 TaxID=765915 RepID=A0A1Y2HQ48_9FUNG|nr:hypothetical protein BCR44DRAFT_281439 [Catenaria anguillulae PL171]